MKRVLVFVAVAILLSATAVCAQTHPCDLPPVTTVSTNGPVAVGFCLLPVDADGNSIPMSAVTNIRITVDGTQVFSGPLAPVGAFAADGRGYFETPKTLSFAKGQHRMVVFASIGTDEGQGSDPFDWTLKGVPPGPPIVKGPKK